MDARESRFASNTPNPVCFKGTRQLIRLPEMVAFKHPLTLDFGQ